MGIHRHQFRRIVSLWTMLGALSLLFGPVGAKPKGGDQGTILIIASYNPDTRRMSSFISEFENQIDQRGVPWNILVEDMGCKGIDEVGRWQHRMTNILQSYEEDELQAVVLLGQESWASFLQQETLPEGVPFFGCFASANGILLPGDSISLQDWMPQSIDTEELARSRGEAGGHLNRYDLDRNIELITTLYPNTRHIAFVSDNTYGGISLQALVRAREHDFPGVDFLFIDGREGEEYSVRQIAELPSNTVVLLGTWRVGAGGQYLMYSSMESLLAGNPTIPVFTISGTGLGSVAIGGYVPQYDNGAVTISSQISRYYEGTSNAVHFDVSEGEYRFDQARLKAFGIERYKLPKGSVIFDDNEARFAKYRNYIFASLGGLAILTLVVLVLYYLYYKNKSLTDVLRSRESELIAARDKAQESDRLKSAFLANMSHEIRTPLNAIIGFSALLQEDGLEPEDREEYKRLINTNSELMLTLISDILDISRLETGKTAFNIEQADIVLLCQQVILTTAYNRKAGVECFLQCDYDTYLLRTDVKRLSQLLINLLTNANKFTAKGQIIVSFRERPNCGQVEFSVTDTGTGIPLDKQTKVFDRFEKLDEFTQGTGLGLSICKQIAFQLGGDIWVDPTWQNGARFVFTHSTRL